MRLNAIIIIGALLAGGSAGASAQEMTNACHASSSYDLTVAAGSLLFDRAEPAPRRIQLQAGRLAVDGASVALTAESRDRLALFEEQLRAMLPKVRAVADRGVDMAIAAVRAETTSLGISAATQAQIDANLATHAGALRQRIAASSTTHDWHGDAFERTVNNIAADIVPLLSADLGQQAVADALSGDLDAAASLQARATGLATDLEPRLQRRMQALQPQIQALCPAIKRLYELQREVRGANGRPLDLLTIDSR